MKQLIKEVLLKIGDQTEIKEMKQVYGGSINDSFYVKSNDNEFFVKIHSNAPGDFFKKEVEGLQLIRGTNTIAVPEVFHFSDQLPDAYLALEWIEGSKTEDTEYLLGKNIARLHKTNFDKHGYSSSTYIGTVPQQNRLLDDWIDYFRDYRIKGQYEVGVINGRISGRRRTLLEKMILKLDEFLPKNIKASYLHGDLWSGNWVVGKNGIPYVIDPSFLYGDRYFDLAFTELFSGFSKQFYVAYNDIFPIEKYYEDIKEIYQLYYLLVHLNIFGETYGPSVDRVLTKYVG